MSSDKTARFMAALQILAPADDKGLRMFKVRKQSTCVGVIDANEDGTAAVRSLVGLESAPTGRAYAMSTICYLADVYDTCLTADGSTVLRDVGGQVSGGDWLAPFGFARTHDGDLVRLAQSLQHRRAA
ncbi:hypothetical protein G6L37_04440 [Agrobacterium rubi]|nr:hypothetical protein [Agrobacterium rubi]NTF24601.1 hypothetical protein [Agrobacterium rubi]